MENGNYHTGPTDRIKLNVGGKLFETTVTTLRTTDPDSLLAVLSTRHGDDDDHEPVFIDRDPEIFSVFLSLLRSGRLPSVARRFSAQELADEALYYGIESQLRSAMSPHPLSGIDASVVATIRPASDGIPTAFCAGADDGSVWIAHGGQISCYDWNLAHAGTLRTHLEEITSLRRVWPEIAAIGSMSAAGVHFYDFAGGRHVSSVHWSDATDPRVYKARVAAIADSDDSIFASFECRHKENAVLVIDKSTLKTVSEIGRNTGNSAKSVVPGKLTYLPENNLLFGCAVISGAFGYSGYIRLWDVRSGDVVWETNEPGSGRSSRFGDSFADVDVDPDESQIFKVCSKSGDLAVADLRNLVDDPWVYLEEPNPSLRNSGGGMNSILHCYKKQVFVSRECGLEVWSRLNGCSSTETVSENSHSSSDSSSNSNSNSNSYSHRRNFVDKDENSRRGMIQSMAGGGDRLFVSREGVEGIEVWESSDFSASISVS